MSIIIYPVGEVVCWADEKIIVNGTDVMEPEDGDRTLTPNCGGDAPTYCLSHMTTLATKADVEAHCDELRPHGLLRDCPVHGPESLR